MDRERVKEKVRMKERGMSEGEGERGSKRERDQ